MRSNFVGVLVAGLCAGSPLVGAFAGLGCEGRASAVPPVPASSPDPDAALGPEPTRPIAGGTYARLDSNRYGAYALAPNAPDLGERAPDFTLPDQWGKALTLSEVASKAPVVLVFYRGFW